MKISYAICTHNEGQYIESLLSQIGLHLNQEKEIVILDDSSDDPTTREILDTFTKNIINTSLHIRKFNKDFSEHKNYLNSLCKGTWIINLDADEFVTKEWLELTEQVIDSNSELEALWVPRINTVSGLTTEHIQKWGWRVSYSVGPTPVINFPDYQLRIYRNLPDIKWISKVHERITGYKKFAHLPADPLWAIQHHKNIERQEKQNLFYETLMGDK